MKQVESDRNIPTNGVALAIIGIGCHFPQAENSSDYWANIREGIDAITDIPATHWRVADYHHQDPASPDMTYGQRGGFLSSIPFNPMEFNIPPPRWRRSTHPSSSDWLQPVRRSGMPDTAQTGSTTAAG